MMASCASFNSLFTHNTISIPLPKNIEVSGHSENFKKLMKLLRKRSVRFAHVLKELEKWEINDCDCFLRWVDTFNVAVEEHRSSIQNQYIWTKSATVFVLDALNVFLRFSTLSHNDQPLLISAYCLNAFENLYGLYLRILQIINYTSHRFIYRYGEQFWEIFVLLLFIGTEKVNELVVYVEKIGDKQVLDEIFNNFNLYFTWLGLKSAKVSVVHQHVEPFLEDYDLYTANTRKNGLQALEHIIDKCKVGCIVSMMMGRLPQKYNPFLKLVEHFDNVNFYKIVANRTNILQSLLPLDLRSEMEEIKDVSADDCILLCTYAVLDAINWTMSSSSSSMMTMNITNFTELAASIGVATFNKKYISTLVSEIGNYIKNFDQTSKELTERLSLLMKVTKSLKKEHKITETANCGSRDHSDDVLDAWYVYFEWRIKKGNRKLHFLNNLYSKAFAMTKAKILVVMTKKSKSSNDQYTQTDALPANEINESSTQTHSAIDQMEIWNFLETSLVINFVQRLENEYPRGKHKFIRMSPQLRRYILCYVSMCGFQPREAFERIDRLLSSFAEKTTQTDKVKVDESHRSAATSSFVQNQAHDENFLIDPEKMEKISIYKVKDRGDDNLELRALFGTKRTTDFQFEKKGKTMKYEKAMDDNDEPAPIKDNIDSAGETDAKSTPSSNGGDVSRANGDTI